jgi:hypothetical protein
MSLVPLYDLCQCLGDLVKTEAKRLHERNEIWTSNQTGFDDVLLLKRLTKSEISPCVSSPLQLLQLFPNFNHD